SFIPCDIDYFYNYTIPMALGPKAVLAPFWDDLEVINEDSIRVYTKYEQNNGRYIIEWSRALNGFDEVTEETFAIYLYNQESIPTESGDGVIEFHYLDIADIDADKNFSTIGIEDHTKNEGIQYVFNNIYATGAAQLQNQRSIRFTTEAPINYVSSLSFINEDNLPVGFQMFPAYPNPFNPSTTISYQLPNVSDVKISIIDLLGNEVDVLLSERNYSGKYNVQWQGIDRFGKSVSSGTYFVVLEALNSRKIQKILFIK
ncbi:MAG: T9SS type A sorting domain-containing protein, partial [Candidatus Neomarinimicrobiota bacterium]|nr:T9SS type A sorting domain-containing protein [Candidatus Neomarinimicrobiota bacterium]